MSQLVALSVSIGLLGAVATFLSLKTGLLIWAMFIAWACFFHAGGDANALKNTIVGNIFGAVLAWIAALIIASGKLPGPVWAAIIVGITVFIIVVGASIKAFSVIPANVYGYAATFAFLLQTPDKMTVDKLRAVSLDNALIIVIISMVIGAIFGILSAKLGAALGPKAAAS